MAGGVEDVAGETFLTLFGVGSYCDDLAFVQGVVGSGDGGGGDAEPVGLNVHHFYLGEVVFVVEDGGTGELLEAVGSSDVVDVGVGDEDLLDDEVVLGEEGHDGGDVVAGVDDDGFVGGLVAEDGAVALEGSDGDNFVDHGSFRVMANGSGLTWICLGMEMKGSPLPDDRQRQRRKKQMQIQEQIQGFFASLRMRAKRKQN